MALFGKKKEEKKEKVVTGEVKAEPKKEISKKTSVKEAPKKEEKTTTNKIGIDYSWVLIKPRITEKSAMMGGGNVYTFDVAMRASKILVKKAINSIYNVNPVKVNIIKGKPQNVIVRGRKGKRAGYKKAMVFLGAKDTIQFN